MDFEELDLYPVIESPSSAAASKSRALRWARATEALGTAVLKLAAIDEEITTVCHNEEIDSSYLSCLEEARIEASVEVDDTFADREMLKPEYWGK